MVSKIPLEICFINKIGWRKVLSSAEFSQDFLHLLMQIHWIPHMISVFNCTISSQYVLSFTQSTLPKSTSLTFFFLLILFLILPQMECCYHSLQLQTTMPSALPAKMLLCQQPVRFPITWLSFVIHFRSSFTWLIIVAFLLNL